MITINDHDLPITVAEKIVTGTREESAMPTVVTALRKALGVTSTGPDMFSLEEIEEIAMYLITYVETHKDGEG